MEYLLGLLAATYLGVVVWVARRRRSDVRPPAPEPPTTPSSQDLPPAAAVGWPPGGKSFAAYVDGGFLALDAYLSEESTS